MTSELNDVGYLLHQIRELKARLAESEAMSETRRQMLADSIENVTKLVAERNALWSRIECEAAEEYL